MKTEYEKEHETLKAKANQGDADAQFLLGETTIIRALMGDAVENDMDAAVAWLRESAEQGNAQAQLSLANTLCYGSCGTEKNPVEAVKWYRQLSEQGNAQAQLALANAYWTGDGVKKNPVEAVKWYRQLSEQGNAHAQSELAKAYWQGGAGIEKDKCAVAVWWIKSFINRR